MKRPQWVSNVLDKKSIIDIMTEIHNENRGRKKVTSQIVLNAECLGWFIDNFKTYDKKFEKEFIKIAKRILKDFYDRWEKNSAV